MNAKMFGITGHKGQYQLVDVFGYATQGLPGIEIIGVGKSARSLKEKIVYFTRWHGVKLPLKRYILCIDGAEQLTEKMNYALLELAFLIILWQLAGLLPIQRLDDCLAFGKLSSDGSVGLPQDLRPIKSLIDSYCGATGEQIKTFLDANTQVWPGTILPLNEILSANLAVKKIVTGQAELASVLPLHSVLN